MLAAEKAKQAMVEAAAQKLAKQVEEAAVKAAEAEI